ncbi:tenascin-N-like [Spea bombifrons]|uniref:tenascin-N-like n=1 Tax=Spea bombifrons TaxID=233779 RepID=UPI00234BF34A|nr:tenascin-N-like [Spea bombifrons]
MDTMTFMGLLVKFLLFCPCHLLISAAALKGTETKSCSSEKALTITHVYSVPGEENEQLETLESDDQKLVFRHHISLKSPASDCEKDGLIQALLSRLAALETEMKEFKEQCQGCCGAAAQCNTCNGRGRFIPELNRCQCDDGWEGPDCATKSCPGNCAGNGACVDGVCQCAEGYAGSDCNEKLCIPECGRFGKCVDGTCRCAEGYTGSACNEKLCIPECGRFGKCVDGTCRCAEGYTGSACNEKLCIPECGRFGKCVDGTCRCAEGYTGPTCRKKKCPFDCGEFGTCVDGTCKCVDGYTGPACRKKKCPVDCGEFGKCVDGVCQCSEGYTGLDCREKKCAVDCAPNGRCVDGVCVCNEGFIGISCDIEIAGLCSGNGRYQVDTGSCQCDKGWEGADCSRRSCVPDCGEHGACVNGACQCALGYSGPTCREKDCAISCGDNGRCDGGQCFCDEGFYGEGCTQLMAVQNLRLVSSTEDSLNIAWDLLMDVDYYLLTYYPFGDETLKKQIQVSESQDAYQILSLIPGTLYKILMYQIKNGVTGEPAELQARTDTISLETLWVTEETEDSLEVEWENPLFKVDYFKLAYAAQPDGAETVVKVSQSSDAKSRHIITGLRPSTTYDISVRAVRGAAEGKSSTVIGVTGIDGPKNLRTTEVGEETVRLTWEPSQAEIDKYILSYRSIDGATEEVSVDKGKVSTLLSGLIPGMEYTFQLWAEKDGKRSKRASVTATTDIDAPKDLQSSEVTESEFSLTWTPPLAQIDGYILYYEDSNGNRQEVQLDSASKSFLLRDLKLGLKYTVYLVAYKGGQRSKQASTFFYTGIDPPTNLQSSQITQSEASLTWTPPTAQIDGYILTYVDSDGNSQEIELDETSTSYLLTGLKKGIKYTVYLVAYKGDRRSRQAVTFFSTLTVVITHPVNCAQVRLSGNPESGVYTIYPAGDKGKSIRVYCDQETDGGGWTVFQRRSNGNLDFYQKWRTYVEGFGDPSDEFWLGLEWIHLLTSSSVPYELRVDLRTGDESAYAVYRTFYVGSSRDKYKLTVSDYSGTAGDALVYHNGLKFTTWDRDNDLALTNCALSHRGAFWYKNCHLANPNGQYGDNNHSQGVNWETWKGHEYSIPFIEMKIRPVALAESNN